MAQKFEISREKLEARFVALTGETVPENATTMDLFTWVREESDRVALADATREFEDENRTGAF